MDGLGTKTPPPVDWPREADPKLYDFYSECLLEPGLEGPEPELVTSRYIAWHLTHNPGLRRQWRIVEALGRRARRVTHGMARRLCQWWVEETLRTPCVAPEVPSPAMWAERKVPNPMRKPRGRRQSVAV